MKKGMKKSITHGASLFIFWMETISPALSQPWLKIQGHVLNAIRFDTHVQEDDLKFVYRIENHLFLQSFSDLLKGFSRLIVGFDVQDGFLRESLSFENCCIKESYFVLWYLIFDRTAVVRWW